MLSRISTIFRENFRQAVQPWGTGQAVLAAKKVLDTPFIVINADDYYGKEGFKAVHEYLVNGGQVLNGWLCAEEHPV